VATDETPAQKWPGSRPASVRIGARFGDIAGLPQV
jgi:hypothetical protein